MVKITTKAVVSLYLLIVTKSIYYAIGKEFIYEPLNSLSHTSNFNPLRKKFEIPFDVFDVYAGYFGCK